MIKQILLTVLVAVIAYLVIQARRRAAARPRPVSGARWRSPQALAGWLLLLVMLALALVTALWPGG